ncbi:response regulator [uncultured Pigmentiphaga sp.]|jgi:Response regulator containing CheY-like receiver, AAA-type ATPase, and DNA-binding domains|uniref:ATP-binding response regulator n=1 Tax=uncultured Pigmentiphaga sp. TaxID=340361 RepID=UPI00260A4A71|nr:response regulator [uncultured Pigmentiphaga sp.]
MPQEPFNILVVDDEPLNLEIISELLSDPRYRLRCVQDGIQAWEVLQGSGVDFDLIVLDRMMPGIDGIELLARIRSDRRFADIPVIMQTAVSHPSDVLEGIHRGAYYYLTKPYEHDMLTAVVGAAIEFRAKQKGLRRRLSDVHDVFAHMRQALFEFVSLVEARQLAFFLAKLCPAPEVAVIGLAELMVNAVEHGNLEIGFQEKGRLSMEGRWTAEIERRLSLPPYRDRVATVSFERGPQWIRFRVRDQGNGFDWREYLEMSPDRAFEMHGRGIAMAKALTFKDLTYEDGGREAVGTIPLNG